jgi:hypothetical protein
MKKNKIFNIFFRVICIFFCRKILLGRRRISSYEQIHCMPNFLYDKQVKIMVASMALHNFIRKHAINNAEFQPYDDGEDLLPTDSIGDDEAQDESSI